MGLENESVLVKSEAGPEARAALEPSTASPQPSRPPAKPAPKPIDAAKREAAAAKQRVRRAIDQLKRAKDEVELEGLMRARMGEPKPAQGELPLASAAELAAPQVAAFLKNVNQLFWKGSYWELSSQEQTTVADGVTPCIVKYAGEAVATPEGVAIATVLMVFGPRLLKWAKDEFMPGPEQPAKEPLPAQEVARGAEVSA